MICLLACIGNEQHVHYPDCNIKKVRSSKRDVRKMDWYKMPLNLFQMPVYYTFLLQFRFECPHSEYLIREGSGLRAL